MATKPVSSPALDIDSDEDVRLYEFAILYPYPLGQKEEQDLLKEIEELFTEADGKVVLKDPWGRRGLAYNIGGYDEGIFVILYVELLPSKVREIDRQLKILKGVLRHMIVKPPKNYQLRSYADTYEKWKEQSRLEEEKRAQEKEDKLKKQVVDKARRVKRPEERKPEEAKPIVSKETITKEVEKLISDDLQL